MADASNPRGVYAAVATPLTRSLEPDLEGLIKHSRWLLDNGCNGLAPLGTTGEANSLSLHQRLRIIDALAESDLPAERLIVGGGSCALGDAVTLSARIAALGAEGVLLLPPFYYKGPSEEGLFRFFSETIQRVGGTSLRLYLYHYPALSSVPIPISLILRLRKAYGSTICGVKDSSGDWNYTSQLLKEIPGFAVFSGSEEFLLRNLQAGGPGCISATTNVTCRAAQKLYMNWCSTEAPHLQEDLNRLRFIIQKFPMQAAVKELLAERTGKADWRILMPPNEPLSESQRLTLNREIEGVSERPRQ